MLFQTKIEFLGKATFPLFQVLCSIVAVTQHYLRTALFSWMLVEGINLYIKIVKVFSVKKQYLAYAVIGWGKCVFFPFLLWCLLSL